MTISLFSDDEAAVQGYRPLADRLRPQAIEEVLGQGHLLEDGAPLAEILSSGHLTSLIFWGSPGTGKTTMARLIAANCGCRMETVSAVTSGAPAIKKICDEAAIRHKRGEQTVLFVDEIHRFNRAQQDVFLPYIESGAVILLGATTENPSFELNAALLSRCTVLVLKTLDETALEELLCRAEKEEGKNLPLDAEARKHLCSIADGDGRYLLGLAERLFHVKQNKPLDVTALAKLLQRRAPVYDKQQESHYNLISALHKSLRGSDVDAALYWLARMLEGGEDPHYILRRLTRFASEDVGLADPQALLTANAAWDTYDRLGSPEGDLAIAQLVIHLATAPKSNASYTAFNRARKAAVTNGSLPPPQHAVNAPTKLMKELGYGHGYAYDHDADEGCSGQNYFPDQMARENYYHPAERGFEREIVKRLRYWDAIREKKKAEG